ncbi:MAG: type II secretion system F family protein [Geminicoccaceae bacterium]
MKMLAQGRHPHMLLASLRPDPRAADIAKVFPILGRLAHLLTQAGASGSLGWPLLSMAACGALALALLRALTALPSTFASMLAGALGVGLPLLYLMLCRARRRHRFEEQLPEAVELLARSLRAGDTLSGALAAVAREMPDPLGSEFGLVVDEISYGRAPDVALARLEGRVDLPDLRCLTLVVQIRSGADGNLAAALDAFAKAMRDQFGMCRGISRPTAEGR